MSVQDLLLSALSRLLLLLGSFVCLYLLHLILYAIYSLTLHPLSVYPGPLLWATTRFPHTKHTIAGTLPFAVAALHQRYGPIVRIGFNELSYIRADAWKDIYGHQPHGRLELPKDPTAFAGAPGNATGILLSRSSRDHMRMRRNLNPGFSDRAMREQEPRIMWFVDLLVQRLGERAGQGPVDVCAWYNFTSFDIVGELFFGESFDCLENSMWNDWVKLIFPGVKASVLFGLSRKFSPFDKVLNLLVPKKLKDQKAWHRQYVHEKLDRRLARTDGAPDFLSHAQKLVDTPDGFSLAELRATSDSFTTAGSETTATLLTAATFFLLKNPSKLDILIEEIRSSFSSDADITMRSVNNLKYELAVLEEALRIFPPAAGTSTRIIPEEGVTICGRYVPPGTAVGVSQWAAYRSPLNFRDPDDFVPERWLGDERYADDDKAVFQPFSTGPRNCIGRTLAYSEMRVILAKMLWNFDLELCKESENWLDNLKVWFLWHKDPLMVRLTPVKRE